MLLYSVNFRPGCPVCATCACQPVLIDLLQDDPFSLYTSVNNNCVICFKGVVVKRRCTTCDSPDPLSCGCLFARLAEIKKAQRQEEEEEQRIRRIGRAFVEGVRALGGGGSLRSLSRQLTRRGR